MIVTITGKSGSGKDTVADALAESLEVPTQRVTFSDLLREELDYGIFALGNHRGDRDAAIAAAGAAMNLPDAAAIELYDLLGDLDADSSSRHPNVTKALVKLGSTWRPLGHWPTRVVSRCRGIEASGKTVILAGNRFPDEHLAFAPWALRIRLDIDPKTQAQRIFDRDGVILDEEFLTGFGETALDERKDFDLRIDATLSVAEIVNKIMTKMNSERV